MIHEHEVSERNRRYVPYGKIRPLHQFYYQSLRPEASGGSGCRYLSENDWGYQIPFSHNGNEYVHTKGNNVLLRE